MSQNRQWQICFYMKPKNRIYCQACGRSKLLFETEKKALLFIKFNANEILEENEVAPTRAYYCESCMGWHVTHIKNGSLVEQRIAESKAKQEAMEKWITEQKSSMKLQLEARRKELELQYQAHNDSIYKKSIDLLEQAKTQFKEGMVQEAIESLKKSRKTSLDIKKFSGMTVGKRFKSIRIEIDNLLALYKKHL